MRPRTPRLSRTRDGSRTEGPRYRSPGTGRVVGSQGQPGQSYQSFPEKIGAGLTSQSVFWPQDRAQGSTHLWSWQARCEPQSEFSSHSPAIQPPLYGSPWWPGRHLHSGQPPTSSHSAPGPQTPSTQGLGRQSPAGSEICLGLRLAEDRIFNNTNIIL